MNDMEIIEMYFRRDENAIRQTEIKYGVFCKFMKMQKNASTTRI